VKYPEISIKNEYHKRVSPIVRSGGRLRDCHSVAMNTPKVIIAATVSSFAHLLFVLEESARNAPVKDKSIVHTAKYGK
jgi:hypothetical protein